MKNILFTFAAMLIGTSLLTAQQNVISNISVSNTSNSNYVLVGQIQQGADKVASDVLIQDYSDYNYINVTQDGKGLDNKVSITDDSDVNSAYVNQTLLSM